MKENESFLKEGEINSPKKKKIKIEKAVVITDDFITTELKKFNIADARIAEWKEQFLQLKIAGIHDKETYLLVDNARKLIKRARIDVEDKGKDLRKDAISFQRAVIAEEKRLVTLIEPIESYLENEVKKIDDEKAAEKAKKEATEQERLHKRVALLTSKGMLFNGVDYIIADHVISSVQVKLMDELSFTNFLAKVEVEFVKEQERKTAIEAEQKAKAEETARIAEAQAKERTALEAKQKELDAREAKLKADAEAQAKRLAEGKLATEQSLIKHRATILYSLGMSFTGENHVFQDIVVTGAQIKDLSAEAFDKLVGGIAPLINKKKQEIETLRLAEIEKAKEEAVLKATREVQAKEAHEKQVAYEKEINAKREVERIAALLPDKQKFLDFANFVEALMIIEMGTDEGKRMKLEVMEAKNKLATWIRNKTNSLK